MGDDSVLVTATNHITSDFAKYYLMLGSAEIKENKDEYNLHKLMPLIKNNMLMTDNDRQEVWEVLVYMKMVSNSIEVFTSNLPIPADYLGNYSLVREWSPELEQYNQAVVNNKFGEVNNYGNIPKWEEFRRFYNVYQEFSGKKQYVILLREDAGKRVKPTEDKETNIENRGYKNSVFQEETLAVYSLGDVLDDFERRYPEIKTNLLGRNIPKWKGRRKLIKLVDDIQVGIRRYNWHKLKQKKQ